MPEVALIIIYNHRYDANIEPIEHLYKHKFQDIYHLIPFYDGDKENVIPVYENSHYFQGYIAQGFQQYFKKEYRHYIFVADDMILNPAINEKIIRITSSFQITLVFLISIVFVRRKKIGGLILNLYFSTRSKLMA